jgi:predicted Fe-Mo cluster-binding NifX family protein
MRIAIPVTNGTLSEHFGHCEQFAIFDIDSDAKNITGQQMLAPPPHEPGLLPDWLSQLAVQVVIAGGMGRRAQQLFKQSNIDVVIGAPDNTPQELVEKYLIGQLRCGQNICDH